MSNIAKNNCHSFILSPKFMCYECQQLRGFYLLVLTQLQCNNDRSNILFRKALRFIIHHTFSYLFDFTLSIFKTIVIFG